MKKPIDDGHFKKSNPLLKHMGKMNKIEQALVVNAVFRYQVDV